MTPPLPWSLSPTADVLAGDLAEDLRACSRAVALSCLSPEARLASQLAAAERHLSIDMRRAVAKLSRRRREVVLLVYVVGMTAPEAAAALGLDDQTAREYLATARERLKAVGGG